MDCIFIKNTIHKTQK